MRLKGKTAIITGAGRGLGRASAIAMAREGAAVVIVSRTTDEIRDAAAAITATGGEALALAGDISDSGVIAEVVDTAIGTFGGIDILMNNAAVVAPFKPLWQVSPGEWRARLAINLDAPQMLCHAVVPHMVRRKSGKIINVTSGLAELVIPPFGVYAVAKAGLDHLTRYLAEELREYNIQVNGLNPGVMDTRMQEEIREAGPERLGTKVFGDFTELKERKQLVPADRVALLAVFLASAAADRVTGMIGSAREYERFGFRV